MDNSQAIGLTLTTVGTTMAVYSQVLPPAHQVAGGPADPGSAAMVRRQCSQAAVMALALGGGASMLAKSPWPLVGAAVVSGWMWWQYDQAAALDGVKLA